MNAEVMRRVVSAVQDETEIRIKLGDLDASVEIEKIELIDGTLYCIMGSWERISMKRGEKNGSTTD